MTGWKSSWLAFDTEATGGSAAARMVSIGIVQFAHGKPVSTFLEHFHPGPIDWRSGEVWHAMRVNGLERRFLEQQPPLAKRWPSVLRVFAMSNVWVAHNATSDLRLLRAERARWDASRGESSTPTMPRAKVLDTMVLDKFLRPGERSRNLAAVCQRWDVPLERAHAADADAVACGLVLARMREHLPDDLRDVLAIGTPSCRA